GRPGQLVRPGRVRPRAGRDCRRGARPGGRRRRRTAGADPAMTLRALAGATLVPGQRVGRWLALAALIDSTGTGLFMTGSAIYFTRVVGLSAAQVGLGLSVAGLVGLLGSVPIGVLGDRFGP